MRTKLTVVLDAVFFLLAGATIMAFADTTKPTFEQAVAAYYRSVAVLNSHQVQWTQTIQADGKAVDAAAETMRNACIGSLDGMDKFEPVCTPEKLKSLPVK